MRREVWELNERKIAKDNHLGAGNRVGRDHWVVEAEYTLEKDKMPFEEEWEASMEKPIRRDKQKEMSDEEDEQ